MFWPRSQWGIGRYGRVFFVFATAACACVPNPTSDSLSRSPDNAGLGRGATAGIAARSARRAVHSRVAAGRSLVDVPELDRRPYRRPRETNASQHQGTQAESSIALDPESPNTLIAATMNFSGGSLMTLASSDGGNTFTKALIPRSADTNNHADPWVRFGRNSAAYLAFIPVAPPGNVPLGIAVATSTDQGTTWSPARRISNDARDDKLTLEVDTNPASKWVDRVYVAWKRPNGGVFVSSGPGGDFSPPRQISSLIVSGLDMAIAADGTVYLVAHNRFSARGDRIAVWRSADGGKRWDEVGSPAAVRADWYTATPSVCTRMALIHPTIGVDVSGGARDGNLYTAWPDYAASLGPNPVCGNACDPDAPCSSDIYYSSSEDRGESWSSPVLVHEEELTGADQFQPWLEVDSSTGAILVTYRDTREDRLRQRNAVYVARSTDGISWEPSFRLSRRPGHAQGGFQYGDYQQHAVRDGSLVGAWADFRGEYATAGELFVGRVGFKGGSGQWSGRLGESGQLELEWQGTIRGRRSLDVFLWIWDPATDTVTWVDREGAPHARPKPAQSLTRVRKRARIELQVTASALARLRRIGTSGILMAQVLDKGVRPDSARRVQSSRLKWPLG